LVLRSIAYREKLSVSLLRFRAPLPMLIVISHSAMTSAVIYSLFDEFRKGASWSNILAAVDKL
jgi:hypothetical protein